jgi:predicted nucleic acid-binding protein
MYAVGGEHPYRESCNRIVAAVIEAKIDAVTDVEVIQEIAHRYHALRRPEGPDIARGFLSVMEDAATDSGRAETVLPVTRREIAHSLELQRVYPDLRPRDVIHLAVMLEAGIDRIVTADRHFDLVKEVQRVDPAELRW